MKAKTPRASLTIDLLSDEDYRVLVRSRGGAETFGVFVMVLVVGRDRLQRGHAERVAESDSLRLEESLEHVAVLAGCTAKQIEKCLGCLAEIAKVTGRKPWLFLDKSGRLVIRSFFKFNTKEGWGGSRDGAGRKSSGNQDDSHKNHLDSQPESSCGVSRVKDNDTSTDNGLVTDNDTRKPRVVSSSGGPPPEKTIPLPTDDDMIAIDRGPHEHTPADFEPLYQKVWRSWGSQPLCQEFYRRQRQFTLDQWERAFGTAKSQRWKPGSIGYVEAIAANPKQRGRGNASAGEFEPKPTEIKFHTAPADSPFRKGQTS